MRCGAPLSIEERVEGADVRLTLSGELDLDTRYELRRRLLRARDRGQDVYLDLSKLDFIDAAGAGLLIRALADSHRHDWNLTIASAPPPQVSRVLDLVGAELPPDP